MIRINLLPHHLRPIKRTPIPYFLSGLLLLLALTVMGFLWLGNSTTIFEKSVELQNHRNQLEKLQPIIDEMNTLENQKVILEVRIQVIDGIVKNRIIWSKELWNISRLAPPNVWFSGISLSEKTTSEMKMVKNAKSGGEELKSTPTKHNYLVLKGYATVGGAEQTAAVNPLLFNLQQDPEFSGLFKIDFLPDISPTTVNGQPVTGFTLEYQIIPPEGLSK